MQVADVEFLPLKYLVYLGLQSYGHGNPGYRAADGNGSRCADAYEAVTQSVHCTRGWSDNLNVVAHEGELLLQARYVVDDTTGMSEVIR